MQYTFRILTWSWDSYGLTRMRMVQSVDLLTLRQSPYKSGTHVHPDVQFGAQTV